MNKTKNNHRRALSNNDFQQILSSQISGLLEDNSHKQLLTNQNFGNILFQIPEQNDIASSTEQSLQSDKKTLIMEQNTKYNYSQEQKENIKNQDSCQNLISQIQYMIKGNHPIKEITQKTLNSERYDKNKHLSFTNELLKKHNQVISQSNNNCQSLTPDRKTAKLNVNKINSHKQKSDQIEKSKIEMSNALFNSLLKPDSSKKKLNIEQQESYRRIELQMNKIQKDINTIKIRQDQLDLFNRNIQNQICDFMNENKKQQDYGHQSLQKLEQLEQITKRNEESIQLIKQQFIIEQQPNKFIKGNENIINFGNLTSYKQDSDQYKKLINLKSNNKL